MSDGGQVLSLFGMLLDPALESIAPDTDIKDRDNRVTCHSALIDWQDGQRRHIARITPQAERPYE